MKPKRFDQNEYEKVKVDEFIPGKIEDIQYEEEHKFKFQEKETIAPGIRFKFILEGYKFAHYSRWMKFFYGEKTTLFSKYLIPLIEGAEPNMDFDLDNLKGMRVRIIWTQKGDFQNIELIRPLTEKFKFNSPQSNPLENKIVEVAEEGEIEEEGPLPF